MGIDLDEIVSPDDAPVVVREIGGGMTQIWPDYFPTCEFVLVCIKLFQMLPAGAAGSYALCAAAGNVSGAILCAAAAVNIYLFAPVAIVHGEMLCAAGQCCV